MRALRIIAGIAVLLNALHFVHAIHHFYSSQTAQGPGTWAMILAAILIDLLTFTGGFLLLRQRS
jgi:TM2 domain-containing membrane protein YozV